MEEKSMDKFARGPIRAEMITKSSLRIEGQFNLSRGKKGVTLHPNTARKLAEWILSVTPPSGGADGG
jgi:hypothetical protein